MTTTKLTGEAVRTFKENPPVKDPDFGSIYLSVEEVAQNVGVADAMTRKYQAADENFNAAEQNKSDSLTRSLSDLNMSDAARSQHHQDGMSAWRRDFLKHFDTLALEHFRQAHALLDAVRETEKYTTGPISLAGRYGIINAAPEVRDAWARCDGTQAVELRNIAVVAMKTKNAALCAAAIRRLGQMDKSERTVVGITHLQLAEAGFGEQYGKIKAGLANIKNQADKVVARYRSRMAGGNGGLSPTQKIALNLPA